MQNKKSEGICKCKTKMVNRGGGTYWCPKCGRFRQYYVCVPPEELTPAILFDLRLVADSCKILVGHAKVKNDAK